MTFSKYRCHLVGPNDIQSIQTIYGRSNWCLIEPNDIWWIISYLLESDNRHKHFIEPDNILVYTLLSRTRWHLGEINNVWLNTMAFQLGLCGNETTNIRYRHFEHKANDWLSEMTLSKDQTFVRIRWHIADTDMWYT